MALSNIRLVFLAGNFESASFSSVPSAPFLPSHPAVATSVFLKASFLYDPLHLSVDCGGGGRFPQPPGLVQALPVWLSWVWSPAPPALQTFCGSLTQWLCSWHCLFTHKSLNKGCASLQCPQLPGQLLFSAWISKSCACLNPNSDSTFMPLLSRPEILCPRHLKLYWHTPLCPVHCNVPCPSWPASSARHFLLYPTVPHTSWIVRNNHHHAAPWF